MLASGVRQLLAGLYLGCVRGVNTPRRTAGTFCLREEHEFVQHGCAWHYHGPSAVVPALSDCHACCRSAVKGQSVSFTNHTSHLNPGEQSSHIPHHTLPDPTATQATFSTASRATALQSLNRAVHVRLLGEQRPRRHYLKGSAAALHLAQPCNQSRMRAAACWLHHAHIDIDARGIHHFIASLQVS